MRVGVPEVDSRHDPDNQKGSFLEGKASGTWNSPHTSI